MIATENITQYLPQRPPFVMVDEIVDATEQVSRTKFEIREGHLFVNDGMFTEPGLVENMAQTAAAGTGYHAKQSGKQPVIGYIGALKNLNVMQLPKVGDIITTEIVFKNQVMNVHIVQGTVYNNDIEIANCELKIFLQES